MMKRVLLSLLICFSVFTYADAGQMVTEVIPLGYRSAEEIIPVVRPLVSPAGSVAGLQGQLVVTATPQALSEVRKILAALDKSPSRLLISVRRGNSRTVRRDAASIQGSTDNITFNNGGVAVGAGTGRRNKDTSALSAHAKSNDRESETNIIQQVQVLEGSEAYIATGEELAIRNRGTVRSADGIYRYDSTEFYPAVTGFYVIPRLNGDEVLVEINTVSRMRNKISINGHHPRQRTRDISVSNVSTSVGGKIGEWIAIGSVAHSAVSRSNGIAGLSRQQEQASTLLSLRVEKIK